MGTVSRAACFRLAAAATTAVLLLVTAADSQAPAGFSVVTSPSDSGGEVYYALELGIFRKYGLDVTIVPVPNGEAAAAAVASGKYEIAQGNIAGIAIARARGVPLVLIAPASLYDASAATSALLVRDGGPIKKAADLIGKTIGGPGLRDIGSIAVDMWLLQQGVSPSAVRFVELPSGQLGPAVARGTIDAGLVIEPFLSAALANGSRVLALPYTAVAPHFIIAAYFTTDEWRKAHAAEARAFASAIAETARWANKNHALSAQILEKYTQIHVAPAQTRPVYADRLDPQLLQPLIDAAAKDGELRATFPATTLLAP
jgi:NitT/TauT family transport system substrate-binding protein